MKMVGEAVKHFDYVAGQVTPGGPVGRKLSRLLLGGHLAGDEKPEECLGQRLAALLGGRQNLLAFRNAQALESDSLDWVEHRGLPNHGLHASHTAVDHVDVDLANFGLAMLLSEVNDFGLLLGNELYDFLAEGGGAAH